MKGLFLVCAIDVLVVSVYALPQDESAKAEPTVAEPTNDELAGDEPFSDDSVNDEFAMEESFGDEVANQDQFLERAAQQPNQPSWSRPPTPNIPCTTYTEAGKKQRQEAIDVCKSKGIDHVECVRKFCSAANGPTLNCNSNCTRCPPNSQPYNSNC